MKKFFINLLVIVIILMSDFSVQPVNAASLTCLEFNDVQYQAYLDLDLKAYTDELLPVYASSRVTSIKRSGKGLVGNTITVEGYAFIKDLNFDSPNDLYREIIFVNGLDTSTDAAYRYQVTSQNKGQFLTKNQNLNPSGKYNYNYAMYTVTVDLNNIKKYDNKTYEQMKPGVYFVYMRISDGKHGKLFPLKNITLSDGSIMDLPEAFATIHRNHDELAFAYTQAEYDYNKNGASTTNNFNNNSTNNESSVGKSETIMDANRPLMTPEMCYYNGNRYDFDKVGTWQPIHNQYFATEECQEYVKKYMITPEGVKLDVYAYSDTHITHHIWGYSYTDPYVVGIDDETNTLDYGPVELPELPDDEKRMTNYDENPYDMSNAGQLIIPIN